MESATQGYLQRWLQEQPQLPASPLSWLNRLRAQALERANALRLPTTRDENWRFTDLSPLYQTVFKVPARAGELTLDALQPHLVPEAGARLVFVDGIYVPQLSVPVSAQNIEVSSLVREAAGHEFVLPDSLGQI